MTGPDELRVVGTLHQTTAKTARGHRRLVTQEELDAAADAWEAEIHMHALTDECYLDEIEKHGRALNDNERLRERLEAAEKAIYDGRLYPRHFEAWADQIEIDQGYPGSEVSCLLRRLAALAGEE